MLCVASLDSNERRISNPSVRSMKIPDSLVEVGRFVFLRCFKLVPEGVDTKDNEAVLEHLRSQQEGGGREGDGA